MTDPLLCFLDLTLRISIYDRSTCTHTWHIIYWGEGDTLAILCLWSYLLILLVVTLLLVVPRGLIIIVPLSISRILAVIPIVVASLVVVALVIAALVVVLVIALVVALHGSHGWFNTHLIKGISREPGFTISDGWLLPGCIHPYYRNLGDCCCSFLHSSGYGCSHLLSCCLCNSHPSHSGCSLHV